MFDFERIRQLLIYKREKEKTSLRDVAIQSGVSAATISRFINNKDIVPSNDTVSLLVKWLKIVPDELLLIESASPNDQHQTVDIIAHQIKSDKSLSPVDAETLTEMFRILYQSFANKS